MPGIQGPNPGCAILWEQPRERLRLKEAAVNPTRFAATAAAMLLTIGTLGVTDRLSRISRASFFNPPYWINWFHLLLGGVLGVVRLRGSRHLQSSATLVATAAGLTLGLLGLVLGPMAARRFERPQLADPSDHLAHLGVGLLALWSWRNRRGAMTGAPEL